MTDAYVQKEYGVTPSEFAEFRRGQTIEHARARRSGKIVSFKGKFDSKVFD